MKNARFLSSIHKYNRFIPLDSQEIVYMMAVVYCFSRITDFISYCIDLNVFGVDIILLIELLQFDRNLTLSIELC